MHAVRRWTTKSELGCHGKCQSAVHACKGTAVQRTVQQKDANAINATNVAIWLRFAGQLLSRDGQNLSPKKYTVFLTAPPELFVDIITKL